MPQLLEDYQHHTLLFSTDGKGLGAENLLALVLPDSELSKLVVDTVIAFGPAGGELSMGKNIGAPSAEKASERL